MSDEAVTEMESRRSTQRYGARLHLRRRYKPAIARHVRRLGIAIQTAPSLLAKPRLLLLWLLSARRAQLALVITIVLMTVVAPPAFGWIADTLYPPIIQEKVLLIVIKHHQVVVDPFRDKLYTGLMTISWLLGLALTLLLFVGHLPAAVVLGRRRARALLIASAKQDDPTESARLHTVAHALLINGARPGVAHDQAAVTGSQDAAKTMLISLTKPENTAFVGAENRYRLDRVIGSGGMGVVHAGYDTVLKRPVALKQLFGHLVNDPEQSKRFRQEATALASVTHAHIVGIYDLVEDSGCFWIVMELLSGGSLGDKLRQGNALAVAHSVDVACKIADGLGYAHRLEMVHRDVKPMNILFTSTGTPKLADFGNAKISVPSVHTQHGVTLGSPMYMSPEQAGGETVDHRSDIYSLGISLYHMLTGQVPFNGDLGAILAKHISQAAQAPNELNENIPDELAATVLVMISKRPEDRYQDTAGLIAALRDSIRVAEVG
ncbi:MAG: serine/threonine protein kinase [Gammaproteobacteria bacterium]|nr:serine/threonine protein kinase [Gammaproteobacteria bacterium]